MISKINVGDGFVQYIEHMGSDASVSSIAGISHGNETGPGADKLVEWGHCVPLEFAQVILRIKMPVFVMRQFVRSRTFSFVEMSGRYNDLSDIDFFMPTRCDDPRVIDEFAMAWAEDTERYERLLSYGVPKELARVVLGLGMYTEFYVRMDMNNARKMLKLRTDKHAQYEMQEYARAILEILASIYPIIFEDMNVVE